MLSDLGQLTSLLDVAKKFVITDSGWQMLDFASEMQSLTGKNLTFQTAPYVTTDGHDRRPGREHRRIRRRSSRP